MDLLKRLDDVSELPTIPTTVTKVLQVTADEDAGLADLSKVIHADPSLAAKLLRVANSAFYRRAREIDSIDRAIAMIGFDEVRSLAVSVGAFESVMRPTAGDLFDRAAFWEHSFAVAVAARELAAGTGLGDGDAFAAGLLHDIGKVLLDRFFPEDFERIMRLGREKGGSFFAIERQLEQSTHADMGGYLLERWELPDELVAGVGGHHVPTGHSGPLATTTYLANQLAHAAGFSSDGIERNLTLERILNHPEVAALRAAGRLPDPSLAAEVLERLVKDAEQISGQAAMLM
ncbi:MAG: HDOD domain-containing protein [Candidatus Lernaella stagnicola]|nr:HDOD domain-containing protein [Candidatus Lernaella stagnicola]